MKIMNIIKDFFVKLKLTLFSDEYENTLTYQTNVNDFLYIDNYSQNDSNAILNCECPLRHYVYRDLNTISKRCDKDKSLNYYNEVQKLLDRYIFKGTKQNNDENDTVGAYMKFIGRLR